MVSNELERLGIEGRTVTAVIVGYEEQYLVLETTTGPVIWETDADCCSNTWFSDVVGLPSLLGHPILAASELADVSPFETEEEQNRTRQEEDKVYGVRLLTEAGVCDVVYRNSSNGYYGGSIYYVEADRAYDGEYRIAGWHWRA
jgi:hypothetical protein